MSRVLPAEWARQSAVLVTWPHAGTDWQPALCAVETLYERLATEITERENLIVACHDERVKARVSERLSALGCSPSRVHLHVAPCNDTWSRDHGPITIIDNGVPLLLDFRFNGWGGKFDAALDDRITSELHRAGAFGAAHRADVDLVLEGGSIESDGQGTILTTSRCLLAPTRNPQLDRSAIEQALHQHLGAERVLWLHHGQLEGDDTDAHIDTLARFCDPSTIAYVACDDPEDTHYESLQAMAGELAALRDADGAAYRLMPLPWPRPRYDEQGARLAASYANFLIVNGAVLAPVYDDPADDAALRTLARCFPRHEIVAIPCNALIRQGGSLHCATMQLPEALDRRPA